MADMTQNDESAQEPQQSAGGEQEAGNPFAVDPLAGDDVLPWQWSRPAKVAFILTGVILPILCFAIYPGIQNGPDWQSGEISGFAQLLLLPKPSVAFCPLLLYSMVSMVLMVGWPEWAMRRFWVRFGIYMGVVLAAQYFLLLAISLEEGFLPFILISPFVSMFLWAIAWILIHFYRKPLHDTRKSVITIILVTLFMVLSVLVFWIFLIIPFLCATPWAIIAYGSMAWYVLNRPGIARWQFSLAQLLALVFWAAAYCSAWRWSIKLMLIEYAKLPTTKPDDCYVSTAAARGHRWLVRAEPVWRDDHYDGCHGHLTQVGTGETPVAPFRKGCTEHETTTEKNIQDEALWVNDQMRYLKAAELALAATCRPAHRMCRACYDRLGPPAAAMLFRPVLADAVYLVLKPAEWTARIVLAIVLQGESRLIERLYRD